jgi:hypothetical protein
MIMVLMVGQGRPQPPFGIDYFDLPYFSLTSIIIHSFMKTYLYLGRQSPGLDTYVFFSGVKLV